MNKNRFFLRLIPFGLILFLVSLAQPYSSEANEAGNWIHWSCQKAKHTCIGSAVCVGVATACSFIPFPNPVCMAAAATCSVLLSGTSDFCRKDCSEDNPNTTYCTPPGLPQITDPTIGQTCCKADDPTQLMDPLPESCPRIPDPSPSLPPTVLATLGGANLDIQHMEQLYSVALQQSPISPSPSPSFGPRVGEYSKAYEGEQSSATAGRTTTSDLAGSSNSITGSGTSGGSRGVAGGGGGSGSSLNSDANMNPSAEPSVSPSSLSDLSAEAGYTSGGGFEGISRPKSRSDSTGLNGGGTQSMAFGSDGKNDLPALVGEDPEDYFTRIGIEDDIFKRIHSRYQTVAKKWLDESLKPKPVKK